MKFQEIAAKLGVENYSEKLIEIYDNLDQVCVDPCDLDAIEALEKKYHVLKEHYDAVRAAAADIKNDSVRYPWAKTVATAIKTGQVTSGKLIPTPLSDETPAGDWMPLLLLLPAIPNVEATYRRLEFDEKEIDRIILSFYNCIGATEKRTGRPGYNRSYFNWQLIYVRGALFRFQSFNYELKEMPFAYVLKNRTDGTIQPVMDGGWFHRSGMSRGAVGFEEEEGSFEATFTETEDAYIGHPAVNYLIAKEPVTYPKSEWECVLRPGDHVVSVHIPAKTDLSPEAVEKSYKDGLEFIDKYFPDFKPKAYFCKSWLMDPHLEEILGSESKIAKFQNSFTRWTGESSGQEIFGFVFVGFKGELKDLPEDTTLMRGLKKRYLEGKHIHGYCGVLFR